MVVNNSGDESMSAMGRLVYAVEEMLNNGDSVVEIASLLSVSVAMVKEVQENMEQDRIREMQGMYMGGEP